MVCLQLLDHVHKLLILRRHFQRHFGVVNGDEEKFVNTVHVAAEEHAN